MYVQWRQVKTWFTYNQFNKDNEKPFLHQNVFPTSYQTDKSITKQ